MLEPETEVHVIRREWAKQQAQMSNVRPKVSTVIICRSLGLEVPRTLGLVQRTSRPDTMIMDETEAFTPKQINVWNALKRSCK